MTDWKRLLLNLMIRIVWHSSKYLQFRSSFFHCADTHFISPKNHSTAAPVSFGAINPGLRPRAIHILPLQGNFPCQLPDVVLVGRLQARPTSKFAASFS
jgi:hypothetical protein